MLPESEKLHLTITDTGHTAIVTIDNPPANTWTPEILADLEQIIAHLQRQPEVIALIIASASEKFFSAGADLKRFDSHAAAVPFVERFAAAFEALSDFSGLTIAAINGYAMGGGLEVALACDLRIAEQGAIMALPEASVGLLPCAGGTQNLTRLVGESWAKRMILCGEKIAAEQALDIGLVQEVVGRGASLERAKVLAATVERQSPDALRAAKKLIQFGRAGFSADALQAERVLFLELFAGKNQSEGVRAFLEKRSPRWNYEQN